jgi:hypothetical protein
MVLLTVHRPDAREMASKINEILKAREILGNVPAKVRCHLDGDYAYCLDYPTWVAALVATGTPVEIKDYPLDAVIETDWQDVERDGKATVRDMVEYAYGYLLGWVEGYHPFNGECYYISDVPEDGYLYCVNYDEVRDIAQRRARAATEQEEE